MNSCFLKTIKWSAKNFPSWNKHSDNQRCFCFCDEQKIRKKSFQFERLKHLFESWFFFFIACCCYEISIDDQKSKICEWPKTLVLSCSKIAFTGAVEQGRECYLLHCINLAKYYSRGFWSQELIIELKHLWEWDKIKYAAVAENLPNHWIGKFIKWLEFRECNG